MLQLQTSERCLMFPRLQPSAYYKALPYSYFRPISSTRLLSLGTIPPNTSIMTLYCFTLYPWQFCFNSQRSGPYFVVFSSFFFSRFVTHGQLISSVMTRFDTWLIMRASNLLVLTSWCSANRGTSSQIVRQLDSLLKIPQCSSKAELRKYVHSF